MFPSTFLFPYSVGSRIIRARIRNQVIPNPHRPPINLRLSVSLGLMSYFLSDLSHATMAFLFRFNASLKRLPPNGYLDGAQNRPQDQRLFHGLLRFREIWVVCLQTAVFHEPSEGAGKGAEWQEADTYSHACRR